MASKVSGVIEKIQTGGSSGTIHAIASTAYGYCETAASEQYKNVDMTGFKLEEGVTIHVKFANTNSASNPKLKFNGEENTEAKPIIQYGTTTASWDSGAVLTLTYDGASWIRDQDTNNKVLQTVVGNTYTNWRPLLIGASSSATEGFSPASTIDGAYTTSSITVQPSTGTIRATTFKGNLIGNATSASGANTLIMTSVDNTTLHNTSGTFAFSGSGAPWSGYDWVGLQVGSGNDKFQIVGTIDNNSLLFRNNDSGGTNTSWGSWQMVAHSVRGTQVGNSTQPVYMTSDGVITAGTALKALAYEDSLTYSDVGAAASSHNHNANDINDGILNTARLPSDVVKTYSRNQIGIAPNFDSPGINGYFEIRNSSETTQESGLKPFNGFGNFLNLQTNVSRMQIAGNQDQWYIRGVQSASLDTAMSTTQWNRIVLNSGSWDISITGNAATATSATSATTASKLGSSNIGDSETLMYLNEGTATAGNKVFTLQGGTSVPKNADMSGYKTIGNYYGPGDANAKTVTNTPFGTAASNSHLSFTLKVEASLGSGTQYLRQHWRGYNSGVEAERTSTNSGTSWSTWRTKVFKNSNAATKEGDTNKPVYIAANGQATAISYEINKSVPSDAVFTDHYAWEDITSKPDTATRWPEWNEISQSGAENINEGTSNVTDNTEILTSYASNNGFADTHGKGIVYRRDAIKLYNYIDGKLGTMAHETASNYAKLASPAFTGTPTAPTATNGTNTTQIATTEFVNNTLSYINAMQFKGTLGTGGTVTALPDSHEAGDTYRVITAGTYPIVDSNGKYCEVGTLIICVADGTTASPAHWTAAETNEDGAVIGPTSSTDDAIVRWDGASGRIIQNSGITIDDSNNLTIPGTIYFSTGTSVTNGKPILAYNSSNTKYGIWYKEGSPDIMAFSASGNGDSTTSADFAIKGGGTLYNRGNIIPNTGNSTGVVGSESSPVYVNATGVLTECTWNLLRCKIIGSENDHQRSVIALCKLSGNNTSINSYWHGKIYRVRFNGLVNSHYADVDFTAQYGGEYTFFYSFHTDKENTGVTALTGSGYRACTFTYEGQQYGGLEFAQGNAATFYADGTGSFAPFSIAYYSTNNSGTVLNSEINESLNFSTSQCKRQSDYFYGVLRGNASTATAANITTTTNAVAYYTNTTGTFGSKASANGALYATSANGALQWGTLPIGQGGTGKTSWTQWGIVYASDTDTLAQVTAGAAGNSGLALISNGAAAPEWYSGLSLTGTAAGNYVATFKGSKAATSTSAAAVVIAGGIATGDNSYMSKTVHFVGAAADDPIMTRGISGANSGGQRGANPTASDQGLYLNVNGGPVIVGKNDATATNQLQVAYTYDASSKDTGAFIVAGGAGIGKKLYVGTSVHVGNINAYNTNVLGSFIGPGIISSCVTAAGNGYYLIGGGTQYGRWFIETIGTASNGTTQGAQGASVLEVGNSTPLAPNTATGGAHNSRGIIRIYGKNNYHTDILAQANGNNSCYLPNYDNDMFLVHTGSNEAIGNGKKPVYVAENGRVTVCNTKVGDPYTPIYANNGEFTATSPVQYFTWSISSGKYGVSMTDNDEIFKANTYSITLVVLTGESNLNAPLTWTSGNGTFSISTAAAVSGDVTGYAIIARGVNITNSITFTQKDSNT